MLGTRGRGSRSELDRSVRGGPRALVSLSLAFALLGTAFLLVAPGLSAASAARSPAAPPALTPWQLASDLLAGVWVRTVPRDLEPPLSEARWVRPAITTNGCGVGRAGGWRKPCVYGDTKSRTSVVVFGDSHAAMWFPALSLMADRQHWRLIDMTKVGCPPVEVNTAAWFLRGGVYSACTSWRAIAMAHIKALHPRLVILSWARWLEELEARPTAGIPTGHGSPWLDGVAAMFSFLHHAARRVLFISDIPTLPEYAWRCLPAHRSDVQGCTVSRTAGARLPAVKAAELRLAHQAHVEAIDPTSWFCTPTRCPVIVGHILVYDDNSHMTPQWAKFIEPVAARFIVPIVRRATRR